MYHMYQIQMCHILLHFSYLRFADIWIYQAHPKLHSSVSSWPVAERQSRDGELDEEGEVEEEKEKEEEEEEEE